MDTTIVERRTLFATEDNQAVHELGEAEGIGTFIVGNLVVTGAKLVKKKGRWSLKGSIPLKILHR